MRRIWGKRGAGEMKGRKALRKAKFVLGFGALLCAGLLASGALGMTLVDPGPNSSSSTATDTTAAPSDSSSTATDTTPTTSTPTDTTPSSTDTTPSTTGTTPVYSPS